MLLSPSNSKHLAWTEKNKVNTVACVLETGLVCVYLKLCVFTSVCANLMPAQCVSRQPQMTVRAGVCLIWCLLVSLSPAGPLTAPQRATCGVRGPSYTKVRSRVCLVVHFLATRGRCWQRIWVFTLHENERKLCQLDDNQQKTTFFQSSSWKDQSID